MSADFTCLFNQRPRQEASPRGSAVPMATPRLIVAHPLAGSFQQKRGERWRRLSGRGEERRAGVCVCGSFNGCEKDPASITESSGDAEKQRKHGDFHPKPQKTSQLQRPHTHCVLTESSVPQDGLADEGQVAGLLWGDREEAGFTASNRLNWE